MLLPAFLACIVLATVPGCKTAFSNKSQNIAGSGCCVDTFRLRYQVEAAHGMLRQVEEPVYVGFLDNGFSVGNNSYRQFVFGDSINSVIAYARQDKEGLMYLPCSSGNEDEKALLYFNKNKGYKWKVHIDNSYFWRKEITFIGKSRCKYGDVYTYDVQTDNSYLSLGKCITRIYYSKEKGFLNFSVRMHLATVGIVKAE